MKEDDPKRKTAPLRMEGVDPEDALRAFMKVDPEKVKRAEEKGGEDDHDEE